MNRLTHLILLLACLPAFLLPAALPVCLKRGLGEACCSKGLAVLEASEERPSCCAATTEEPVSPSCCGTSCCEKPAAPDEGEGDQGTIRSACSCCIEFHNTRDQMEKGGDTVDLNLPPTVILPFRPALLAVARAEDLSHRRLGHDPPRLRPLLI